MKNIIILILIALCAFFAFKLATYDKTEDTSSAMIAQSGRELVETDVKSINKKVDERGIERALFDDENQVINSLRQLNDSSKKEIDSMKVLLKIKDNQIISHTSIIAVFKDSLMKAKNEGDSLYSYKDKFASISFHRPNEAFSLQYNAEVNMTEYWKRNWLLGSRRRYVELWMSDPRASINGVKRLRIEARQDNFSVKIKGISDYNSKHQEFGLGGGFEIETKNLEYQGSYLYDLNSKKWYPGFRINLKILEL